MVAGEKGGRREREEEHSGRPESAIWTGALVNIPYGLSHCHSDIAKGMVHNDTRGIRSSEAHGLLTKQMSSNPALISDPISWNLMTFGAT